jgi:hypothetical protein
MKRILRKIGQWQKREYADCFTNGLFKLVSEVKMVQNKPFMKANKEI